MYGTCRKFSQKIHRKNAAIKAYLRWHVGCCFSRPSNIVTKGGLIMLRRILPLLMVLGSLAVAACNTVHGMGKDIQQGGEATQDAADAVKKKL